MSSKSAVYFVMAFSHCQIIVWIDIGKFSPDWYTISANTQESHFLTPCNIFFAKKSFFHQGLRDLDSFWYHHKVDQDVSKKVFRDTCRTWQAHRTCLHNRSVCCTICQHSNTNYFHIFLFLEGRNILHHHLDVFDTREDL